MKHRKFLVYSLILLLSGCSGLSPQAGIPDQSETISKERFTPTSTITASPSITPHPALSPEGPYLAFAISQNGPLILVDIDGIGREAIYLPERSKIHDVKSSISPTGEWAAIHTGELFDPPYDLALILFNLRDGSIRQVADLLASDYPDNLFLVAEQIAESNPNPAVRSVDDWIDPVKMSFTAGIYEFAWSPDGQQLAFPAQIDGPASDLYVYDIKDESINRITGDDNIILKVDWSPNGDLLLFQEAIVDQVYDFSSLHVARADGSQIWDLNPADTPWWGIRGWASPYQVIIDHSGGDAAPPSELYYLDIRTDQRRYLWSDSFYDFAVDPVSQVLAVTGVRDFPEDSQGDFQSGVFLVYPGEEIQLILQYLEPTWLTFIDNPSYDFVGCNSNGALLINKDGSFDYLTNETCHQISVSPDNKWVVVILDSGTVLLFSSEGGFIDEFQAFDVIWPEVIWRPDSLGLFIGETDKITHIAIPDCQASVVYNCDNERFPCVLISDNYSWIPQ